VEKVQKHRHAHTLNRFRPAHPTLLTGPDLPDRSCAA
jgi:hypothetical protein